MIFKRLIAVFIAAVTAVAAVPVTASAAGETDGKTISVGELETLAESGGGVTLAAGYIKITIDGADIDYDIVAAAFPGVAFGEIIAAFTLTTEANPASSPVGEAARFSASVTHGGKTVPVSDFADYVEIAYDGPYVAGATTAVRVRGGHADFPVPANIDAATLTLTARVKSTGVYGCALQSVAFADMTGHWAAPAVKNLSDRMVLSDIITKDSAEFFPDAKVSRAMFTDLLVRGLGITAQTTLRFTDVSESAWYYETLRTAVASGLIKGTSDTTFSPEESISREQVAIIISRVMLGLGISGEGDPNLAAFADASSLSPAGVAEIGPAIAAGILRGDNLGYLRPHDPVTRAEAAVMTERFLKSAGLIN